MTHGIASIGLALAPNIVSMTTLASLRGVPEGKLRDGLGCDRFGVCGPDTSVADLAETAARRALARWDGTLDDIGLIVVGTETGMDMSRPASAWVADRLGLEGSVRSYEVKHACYGGTLALRQALEWRASGAARGKAALVIAADIARYAPDSPAEPTMGAGAVAMIVGAPMVAAVELETEVFSRPAFDFWRPVGQAYPEVEGRLSLDCYRDAAARCFAAWTARTGIDPDAVASSCFHVPFPKMVRKAVAAVGESLGWDEARTEAWWANQVAPTMDWNRASGNAYTASLWISVARALVGAPEGSVLTAFSYGSGFGAELLTLRAGPAAGAAPWAEDVAQDLGAAVVLDGAAYLALRAGEAA